MSATVLMKSNKGAVSFSTDLPNGKKLTIEFKEKDGVFTAEVPTKITFRDDFNTDKVFHENYAQHLLNSYRYLEIIEVQQAPLVSQPTEKKGKKKDEKDS